MIFDNVKVGDKFRERSTGRLIVVTDLTEKGFSYKTEPYNPFPARYGLGMSDSGEIFSKDPNLANCFNFLYVKYE